MIEADCIDPEDVSDDFEGVSADGFDEPEALVGTFDVGESVRVGDYLVELTDAYMEPTGHSFPGCKLPECWGQSGTDAGLGHSDEPSGPGWLSV